MAQMMEPLIDTQEFLSLSAFFNYQLAGAPINWRGIINILVGKPQSLDQMSENFFMEALEYLDEAYGNQKRRLGPLAILHPIRTSALLAKAHHNASTLDLLTALLHDKDEDLTLDRYSKEGWKQLDQKFHQLLKKIDSQANWFLNERISFLTKEKGQKYTEYLGRLLTKAKNTPELVAVKLADRLDNTLDLRISIQDYTDHPRSFQIIFDILFVNSYSGMQVNRPHPAPSKINGAMRLFQLYKNAVFLSLLRFEKIPLNNTAQKLFYSLSVASIREAQTIMTHIFSYHLTDPKDQRSVLLEAMEYSHGGGYEYISKEGPSILDGLFNKYFIYDSPEMKKKISNDLYQNKRLMGLVAISFLIIFANFINSEDHMIKGISATGLIPQN